MQLYDHGTWSLYEPDSLPVSLPPGLSALFCRSDTTGDDWYQFRQQHGVSDESVKLVCHLEENAWVVKVATVDQGKVFPEDRRLVELYDGDLDTPQESYGGMVYRPETNDLIRMPPKPASIPATASKLGLRRVFVEQGNWSQVKALIAADPDTQEEWDLAVEIKRTDPLTLELITAMSLQPAEVDAILIRAKQLTEV
jgi:hypothetical protein